MNKYKISMIDANEHLHIVYVEAKTLEEAMRSIVYSKDLIQLPNDKYVNPAHIVSLKLVK